ncbi:MAG TPA: peptidoglycan editing factor PgeF, partial [Usitatibacter sp.]
IAPDWPAPTRVRAFVTTRHGGVSGGEYASLNLGARGGDDPRNVASNRLVVRDHLPSMPRWMAQAHGTAVCDLDAIGDHDVATADAAVTGTPGTVGVVLTADCMPLFVADRGGTRVGVAHAGWRGMAAGVIENAVSSLGVDPREVVAWMGPTIGPTAFEVGPEVREAFVAADPGARAAFMPHAAGKFMADLYALARRRLARAGVREVHGGGFCTYRETQRFFSYRRVAESGRMGAFIWME